MNKAALIGILLLLSLIPLGQLCIINYQQFTAYQKQAELEEIQCQNSICFGEGMKQLVAQEYFETSMLYLLAAFMIGGVGMVAVGLNRDELTISLTRPADPTSS